jgi:hypothetical protein
MSELGLVRPDMDEVVGRPYGRMTSYPVSASDIRKWARAVHHPRRAPDRYTEQASAENGSLVAPLDFNPFAWGAAETVADATRIALDPAYESSGAMEHHLGIVPPALKRALNGGVAVTYGSVRMKPGDVIAAESVISGYSEKQGRLGPMLLTDVHTTWSNQDGTAVRTHRMTLIRY